MTGPRWGLGPDELDRLVGDGRVESVPRRAIVPLDGPTIVVVLGGIFRIFRNAAFVRDVTVGLASRGDVLAASALFGDRAAETGAEALVAGHVLLLSAEAWHARAEREPELNVRLASSVGRRIGRLEGRLEGLSRSGVEGRIAANLLELARDFGVRVPGGTKLDVALSQEDLARLAGTTRETCSSAVADLARRGLVRGGRLRGLVLVDEPGLRRLAEGLR